MFRPDVQVVYHNDFEYRQCLRDIVNMDKEKLESMRKTLDNVDEISKDELLFDEDAVTKYMDFLYEQTKDNIVFKTIYQLAAGFLFSTDESHGICVLFSYDYMETFYACLREYFRDPESFSIENPSYVRLLQKLK